MTRIYIPPYTDDVQVTVNITSNYIEFEATSIKSGFESCQCSKRLCTVNGLVSLDSICAAEKEAIETVIENVHRAEAMNLVNGIRMKKALEEFAVKHRSRHLSSDELDINNNIYKVKYEFDANTNMCTIELSKKDNVPYFVSEEFYIDQIINRINITTPILCRSHGKIVAKALLYMNYDPAYINTMFYKMVKAICDFEKEYGYISTDDCTQDTI